MANYKSQYTGEQIDDGIAKASLGSCIGYWKIKPTLSIPEEPLYTSIDSMMANAKPVDMVFIQYKEKPYIYNVKLLFIGNVDLSAMGGDYAMLVGKTVLGLTDEGDSFMLYLEGYGGNDDPFLIKQDIGDVTTRQWIFDNCDNVTTYPKTVLYTHCILFQKGTSSTCVYATTTHSEAFTADTISKLHLRTLSARINDNFVCKMSVSNGNITFKTIDGDITHSLTEFSSDVFSII